MEQKISHVNFIYSTKFVLAVLNVIEDSRQNQLWNDRVKLRVAWVKISVVALHIYQV